jgi:hypothetical protein
MQQRIGPESPGISRFLAARFVLLLVAAFYLAGLVFVFLYSLGYDPLENGLHLTWPFGWPG